MRVRSFIGGALVALGAAAVFAGDQGSWLPAEKGWKWTYEVKKVARVAGIVSAKTVGKVTCECTGKEKVGDDECAVLEWSANGEDAEGAVKVWVRANGESVVVARASTMHEPFVVPADAKSKTVKADVKTDSGSVSVETSTTTEEEDVETPAGSFKGLKVSATVDTAGVRATRTVWYAKGTGVVKVLKTASVGGVKADREVVLVKLEKP